MAESVVCSILKKGKKNKKCAFVSREMGGTHVQPRRLERNHEIKVRHEFTQCHSYSLRELTSSGSII
jgi:hypothetical protein